jgi:uncharacterized damage-inducible protein DinB
MAPSEAVAQNNAFAPESLGGDFAQVQRVLADFFEAVSPADWDHPTGRESGAWTLRQTLAHVTFASSLYQQAIDAALAGQPLDIPGLATQRDLFPYNMQQIAARERLPTDTLIQTFLDALSASAQCLATLALDQLALTVKLSYMSRPLSVAELLANQITHPGITHGAQLANGAQRPPLWTHYSPELLQRMITRFFVAQMSPSYSPARGGKLTAAVNFRAGHVGRWHVSVSPAGGFGGEGTAPRAAFTMWTRSADVLCRLLTLQIGPWSAILRGQALAWGDPRLGLKLGYLFLPS